VLIFPVFCDVIFHGHFVLVDVISERSLYAIARPSVVCLSVVCNARAPILRRLKFSAIFLWHLVAYLDIHQKFYGDRPRGTPPSGESNPRGVAKYSDFGPIEGYISETVQDIGDKLVLTTNRKSHMSIQLIQKPVTLNDPERRNGNNYLKIRIMKWHSAMAMASPGATEKS